MCVSEYSNWSCIFVIPVLLLLLLFLLWWFRTESPSLSLFHSFFASMWACVCDFFFMICHCFSFWLICNSRWLMRPSIKSFVWNTFFRWNDREQINKSNKIESNEQHICVTLQLLHTEQLFLGINRIRFLIDAHQNDFIGSVLSLENKSQIPRL